ncbi:hypothetical protein ILUMI_27492 [Ignelater luminosus]|uniref:Retrovirus-related Pol polyprotein from transposon TNT 1-94-like beta-barrel domain-containing protein n=1 Tax=Ignelater luminosus TaxID=2038154 RepID=A0A8K0FY47_IGNLU|nr:hypothetical protein ILUMI_27492 [Ignelater luminosus]
MNENGNMEDHIAELINLSEKWTVVLSSLPRCYDTKRASSSSEFLFMVSPKGFDSCIIDSGATCHIASNKRYFTSFEYADSSINVANGEQASGKGNCKDEFINEHGDISSATVTDVLYVPQIEGNILSVQKLIEKGFEVNFSKSICEVKCGDKQIAVAV